MRWCCSASSTRSTTGSVEENDRSAVTTAITKPSASSIKRFPMVNGGGQKETLALLESQRNSAERGGEVTTVCLETFKEADDRAEGQKSPRKGRRSTKGVQYADEILNTELTTSEATAYACDPSTSAFEAYGPMLLRVSKNAVVVGNFGSQNIASHCQFLSTLKANGWTLNTSTSASAHENVKRFRPSLILIDHKVSDLGTVVKKIREQTIMMTENVLIAQIVDRFPVERRLKALAQLDLHFFLYSNTNLSLCEQFAQMSTRLKAMPALFAVVQEAQQPIKICDEHNIVQYVNRAYEACTGSNREAVLGSRCPEFLPSSKYANTASPPDASLSEMPNLPSSSAAMADRSTTSLPLPPTSSISVEIQPASEAGTRRGSFAPGMETQGSSTTATTIPGGVMFDRRRSSDWHCIPVIGTAIESQQFVYVKRGSTDASMYHRDSIKGSRSQSHGILVNAPLTEAMISLGNIVGKCDDDTQSQLKDVIRILSSAELYTPKVMRFQENDRITSGYYDGLIRIHHPSRQRKRSVVDSFRDHQRRMSTSSGGTISIPADGRRVSADIANVLENDNVWEFDILELERITDHHPLSRLGTKIFDRWNINETLNCAPDTINRWLVIVEANYQSGNAYHNATHAADVLQATSFFLSSEQVGQYVQDQHAMAALIAATIHDLDHPGRGNAFLVNTAARLALLYNDNSVLENHHVALAFQLTLTQSGVNIFARVAREEFIQMRQSIIDMVLATDMSRHFEHLTRFQQLMGILPDTDENREANSMIMCRMLVKCADIANPTREWKLCREWALRIVQEYFDQTTEEIERNLPITMKGFERASCNVPLTQCTFVDMFARETFTSWCQFSGLISLLDRLESNYERWKAEAANWVPETMNLVSHPR